MKRYSNAELEHMADGCPPPDLGRRETCFIIEDLAKEILLLRETVTHYACFEKLSVFDSHHPDYAKGPWRKARKALRGIPEVKGVAGLAEGTVMLVGDTGKVLGKVENVEAPKSPKFINQCNDCQVKAGGIPPDYPVTMWADTCPGCGKENSTIVPASDYAWPNAGVKRTWD